MTSIPIWFEKMMAVNTHRTQGKVQNHKKFQLGINTSSNVTIVFGEFGNLPEIDFAISSFIGSCDAAKNNAITTEIYQTKGCSYANHSYWSSASQERLSNMTSTLAHHIIHTRQREGVTDFAISTEAITHSNAPIQQEDVDRATLMSVRNAFLELSNPKMRMSNGLEIVILCQRPDKPPYNDNHFQRMIDIAKEVLVYQIPPTPKLEGASLAALKKHINAYRIA